MVGHIARQATLWHDRVKLPLWEQMHQDPPAGLFAVDRVLRDFMHPEGERQIAEAVRGAYRRWANSYDEILARAGYDLDNGAPDGVPGGDALALHMAWRDTFRQHSVAVAEWRAALLATAEAHGGKMVGPREEGRQKFDAWAAALRRLWEENPGASAYDAYRLADHDCLSWLGY